jgi:hypothetical protein
LIIIITLNNDVPGAAKETDSDKRMQKASKKQKQKKTPNKGAPGDETKKTSAKFPGHLNARG